jgi:hypothetical protein
MEIWGLVCKNLKTQKERKKERKRYEDLYLGPLVCPDYIPLAVTEWIRV